MITKLWGDHRFRFLVIGSTNTIWGIVSFPILYFLFQSTALNYIGILFITYGINTVISFLTQKIFVFKTKGGHLFEYLKFLLLQLTILGLNLFFLPLAMKISGLGPVIPQIIFGVLTAISSYFFHKFITFSRTTK